jgi:hypothetical protein
MQILLDHSYVAVLCCTKIRSQNPAKATQLPFEY